MRIQNGTLIPVEGASVSDGYVDIANGVITGLGCLGDAPETDDEVFDAQNGYILPGLIDAHTHIGISEEGVRWEGEDCNETTDPITPQMRAVDGFFPFDTAIGKALAAGVTAAGVAPGSTNVIGGQVAALHLYGTDVEEMVIKAPCAVKFALGENPKRNFGNSKGASPMTRMAVSAMMRDTLTRAGRYLAQKENGEDVYDPKMEPLIPLLRGEISAHFHAHRADDILSAVRIAREFHLRYTILHATDADRIIPSLVREGSIPVVGPSMGPAGKPETVGGSFATTGRLYRAGLEVAITTDHDVTPLWLLSFFAAMCVQEGLPEDAALRAITLNPAKVLGIDGQVGSIRAGKMADIAVFTEHPFLYRRKTRAVFIRGKRVI